MVCTETQEHVQGDQISALENVILLYLVEYILMDTGCTINSD